MSYNRENYQDNCVQCSNGVSEIQLSKADGCNNRDRDCEIRNKCTIEFNTCGKKHIFESNEVVADKVKLSVRKYESCQLACEGDCIEYTIVVKNDSCVCIKNCEFVDILSRDLEYEKNSFKLNGKKENPTIVGKGIYFTIPEIKEKCEAIIVFDAKVC